MGTYGKMGASPNPLQRYLTYRLKLSVGLLVAVLWLPFGVFFWFTGGGWPMVVVTVVLYVCFTVGAYARRTELPPEEEWDIKALYVPWPRWMPGYRESSELVALEEARRDLVEKSRPAESC